MDDQREIEPVTGNQMADHILDLVKRYKGVSFVELEHKIKGFGGGDMELLISSHNIVLWQGVTREGFEALKILQQRHLIHPVPAPVLVYLVDGLIPKLPVAKRAIPYKKPHWAPVVFNPGRDPRAKA